MLEQGALHFHLAVGPASYGASPGGEIAGFEPGQWP